MELKGSRTEANLMAAFAGESMARNLTYLLRLTLHTLYLILQIVLVLLLLGRLEINVITLLKSTDSKQITYKSILTTSSPYIASTTLESSEEKLQ